MVVVGQLISLDLSRVIRLYYLILVARRRDFEFGEVLECPLKLADNWKAADQLSPDKKTTRKEYALKFEH